MIVFIFLNIGALLSILISIIVTYIKLMGMIHTTKFDVGFYVMLVYIFCFYMSNIKFEDKSVFVEKGN